MSLAHPFGAAMLVSARGIPTALWNTQRDSIKGCNSGRGWTNESFMRKPSSEYKTGYRKAVAVNIRGSGVRKKSKSQVLAAKATWYSDRFLVPACAYWQGLAPTSLRALFVAVDNRFPHSQY